MKKLNLTNEDKKEIIHLFTTLNNNTSPFISAITGHKPWLIDEFISQHLKLLPKAIIKEPEDIEGEIFQLTEDEMIHISSKSCIIARYNTRCYSAPDFRKRLLTGKIN